MYKLKKIALYFINAYNPDNRALALMRIGVALVVLADLLIRLNDLTAHYTDNGIWPTALAKTLYMAPGNWSLHWLSGSYTYTLALFIIHILASLFLLVGYKTKVANLVVWLLTISLHNRNLYVLQGGDDLLRLLLFWGLFLPWAQNYSIDNVQPVSKSTDFIPKLAYLLLIASVYFFTVNLKSSNEWRSEGSAIYYALSLDQLRLPAGDWLYHYPNLMQMLTRLSYYIELIIPILILWPAQKGYMRGLAFVLIIIFHLAIGLTLYVGLFFIINMVAALGLTPSFVFNHFNKKTMTINRAIIKRAKSAFILKRALNYVAAFAIILCLLVNLSGLNWFVYELKKELNYAVNLLRLNQQWAMFAPSVLKKDGWYVYSGIDLDGNEHDLRKNKSPVDYTKPEHVVSHYKTDRWRKLAENMQMDNYAFLRSPFAKYILRDWNIHHPEKKMVTLNLYFMEEESLPDYATSPVVKNLICVYYDR